MSEVNKDGQAIGRKGAESRARLLEAALVLLAETPAERLTARGIARAAGLASQTFYLYFDDVAEILLCLSQVASEDTADIVAELNLPWDTASLRHHSMQVVGAFYRYWDRHRIILNIRNYYADTGHEAFMRVRNTSAMPIVEKIAARIRASQGEAMLSWRDAIARAVIIFSAIERMAARYASVSDWRSFLDSDDLKRAEADILALLFSPGAVD